jgi:hypothetical protein
MKKGHCLLILIIAVMACRKNYNPPVVAANANYLVVEGIINTGSDSTMFNLSRTVNIKQKIVANPELNAIVSVESDNNAIYPLQAAGNGKYVSPGLNLDNSRTYRLRINTADGKAYLSDFLKVKISPPIDSVGYIVESNGVQIYLNTHDPTNSTRYYLWQYDETWKFNSFFDSYFVLSADTVAFRRPDQQVYFCYASDTTTTIVLNSSAKLTQDVIYQTPITFLSAGSEKIEDRYSILIKQYALTPGAYNYYQLLKTNTQNLGSIFDAQPSQLPGNIHEVNNPAEPVIGYITAGTVSQKRIFVDNRYLPAWLPATYYQMINCAADTMTMNSKAKFDFYYLHNPPYYIPTVLKISGAYPICVDCTFRGTKTPPPFWQ